MIKGYSFQSGMLPLKKKMAKEIMKVLNEECHGFIALSPQYFPKDDIHCTFFVFDTLNNCKEARNIFESYGNNVGKYIMNVEISDDMQYLYIGEPVL